MRPTLSIVVLAATAIMALSSSASASPISLDGVVAADNVVPVENVHHDEVLETRKKHKSARKNKTGMATWYAGSQMDNPACGGGRPKDSDMIAAVAENGPFKCNQRITLQKGGKQVTVRVVDYCASCANNHFDLSKGAFKKLASLGAGEVHGLNYWKS